MGFFLARHAVTELTIRLWLCDQPSLSSGQRPNSVVVGKHRGLAHGPCPGLLFLNSSGEP